VSYSTVSFLSDYGLDDEFVGVVKAVIHDLAPAATVIDLTHGVPPHDVRAGSLALARAIQYVPAGVVLAVVDPGVGTDRRAVAVEVAGGAGVLIGPDNGLLAPAVSLAGGAERAVSLTSTEHQLPSPGPTFAGRDVFAPAAGHLCAGVPLEALGDLIDPAGLLPGVVPLTRVEDGAIHAEVLWVDRFGNAQLNVGPEDVEELGDRIGLRMGDTVRTGVRAGNYAEIGTGRVGLVVDSYGLLSIALDRRSAAEDLGLAAGAAVVLEPLEDGGEGAGSVGGVTTPVALRPRERPE
jgi:S-adenosyl-L-methionine hydrolase (adenosine-forming)